MKRYTNFLDWLTEEQKREIALLIDNLGIFVYTHPNRFPLGKGQEPGARLKPRIRVFTTSPEEIKKLYEATKGYCYVHSYEREGKIFYRWGISSWWACELCKVLLPYLVKKQEKAKLFAVFLDAIGMESSKANHFLSVKQHEARIALHGTPYSLNEYFFFTLYRISDGEILQVRKEKPMYYKIFPFSIKENIEGVAAFSVPPNPVKHYVETTTKKLLEKITNREISFNCWIKDPLP